MQADPSIANDAAEWNDKPLTALVEHILEQHHRYTRDALDRLGDLSRKVLAAHGHLHPELERVHATTVAIEQDLRPHLEKEEVILFPCIAQLDAAARGGDGGDGPRFGVEGPVRVMLEEHEDLIGLLGEIRALTNDYQPPRDSCSTWQAFYAALRALDLDLLRHMHLEADVLFPRALDLTSER